MGKLISIGCRARVGKDTIANFIIPILEKNQKYVIHRTSFVKKARDYVADMFPNLKDTDESKDEYREAMISVVKGTLAIDELAFTKDLVKQVKESPDNNIFIVPDLRRFSEYKYCKDHLSDDMFTIRVDRGEKVDMFGEGDMDDDKFYDLIIDNNGTLEELEEKSKDIVNTLIGELYE